MDHPSNSLSGWSYVQHTFMTLTELALHLHVGPSFDCLNTIRLHVNGRKQTKVYLLCLHNIECVYTVVYAAICQAREPFARILCVVFLFLFYFLLFCSSFLFFFVCQPSAIRASLCLCGRTDVLWAVRIANKFRNAPTHLRGIGFTKPPHFVKLHCCCGNDDRAAEWPENKNVVIQIVLDPSEPSRHSPHPNPVSLQTNTSYGRPLSLSSFSALSFSPLSLMESDGAVIDSLLPSLLRTWLARAVGNGRRDAESKQIFTYTTIAKCQRMVASADREYEPLNVAVHGCSARIISLFNWKMKAGYSYESFTMIDSMDR